MKSICVRFLALFGAFAVCGWAQQGSWEITPSYGVRWGGGLDMGAPSPYDTTVNLTIPTSQSFGVGAGYNFTKHFQFNFNWNRQMSEIQGPNSDPTLTEGRTKLADFRMDSYQFGTDYHFGNVEGKIRPFVTAAVGWSSSRPDISGLSSYNGVSAGFGGGVKYYFNQHFGLKAQLRYMPSFISAQPNGMWCGLAGGCWTTTGTHTLNQADASLGAIFRF